MTTSRDTNDPTLLPSGSARAAVTPEAVTVPGMLPVRRFRWELILGVVLTLAAVAVTLVAIGGLGGPAPADRRTGAPASAPGSQVVVARSGPDGLHVTERLTLPRASSSVQLTRPDLARNGSLSLPQPVISGLTATGDAAGSRTSPTATGWVVEAGKGGGFTTVTIDYQVAGAVVFEPRAPVAGRALLVVTPVSAVAARQAGIPVSVRAPGIDVRQGTCLTSPATQQLCGQADAGGYLVRLSSWQGAAVVVLQADLVT